MSLKLDIDVKLDVKDLKRIRRELIKAASQVAQVGFFDGDPHPNSPERSVAQIAAIQEFGLPEENIPERPFMAATASGTKVGRPIAQALKALLRGTADASNLWFAAGLFYAREMSKTISDFSVPANAPFTIAKKGFDNPLVETGHMRDSVKNRVKRK